MTYDARRRIDYQNAEGACTRCGLLPRGLVTQPGAAAHPTEADCLAELRRVAEGGYDLQSIPALRERIALRER